MDRYEEQDSIKHWEMSSSINFCKLLKARGSLENVKNFVFEMKLVCFLFFCRFRFEDCDEKAPENWNIKPFTRGIYAANSKAIETQISSCYQEETFHLLFWQQNNFWILRKIFCFESIRRKHK